MRIDKTIVFNQKEYAILAELSNSATLKVNGVSCDNVMIIKERKVYYSYLPFRNDLVIIISNHKPFILEIPQDEDITDFVKEKVSVKLSVLGKIWVALSLFAPLIYMSHNIFKFDENFVPLVLLSALLLTVVKILNVYQCYPTVKNSTKQWVFYIVSVVTGIAIFLITLAVAS